MADIFVSLRKAEADFTIRPGARLDVEAIRQTVRSYGFTPTWLECTVKVKLATQEGSPALELVDTHGLTPVGIYASISSLKSTPMTLPLGPMIWEMM